MRKIMIVEDDNLIRELYSRVLKENGYDTVDCCDGKDALTKYDCLADKPDIFLVDNLMPNGNGISLSKEILRRNPQSKILMVSGDPDINLRLLQEYGIRFKQKPISKDDLISEIELLEKIDI